MSIFDKIFKKKDKSAAETQEKSEVATQEAPDVSGKPENAPTSEGDKDSARAAAAEEAEEAEPAAENAAEKPAEKPAERQVKPTMKAEEMPAEKPEFVAAPVEKPAEKPQAEEAKPKGLFGKLFGALKKTKENFSEKLRVLFSKNKLGDAFYEELEEILISSDVSVSTAEEVVERVKERAIGEKLKDEAYVTELLRGTLTDILQEAEVPELSYPCVLMLVGVNGVGKTTTIGKLAHYFLERGKTVTVAAADTFRAAASEQLAIWAERAGVRIVKHEEGSDPAAVIFDAVSSAKARGTDVVIVDTAGRLHVKDNLMKELQKMDRVVTREFPEADFLKLLVLDATTGQNALSQARVFDEAVELDGLVLTKLDGTAKGGFVFSLAAELALPVIFAGTGEKIGDLEKFDSKSFVEAIL